MSESYRVVYNTGSHVEQIQCNLRRDRFDNGLSTHYRKVQVHRVGDSWKEWIHSRTKDFLVVSDPSKRILVHDPVSKNFLEYRLSTESVEVKCYGDIDWVNGLAEEIQENFDELSSHIKWVYDSEGHSVDIPLNTDRLPIEEMYPFLGGQSLGDYYDSYLQSSANILLLIGPPGTGKSTFIRGLLAHSQSSAMVSYDSAVLERDSLFAEFVSSDTSVMVLEDSDNFLRPRSDGNTMMHRFLNVGDGLVTTKGKKMIFSTNLPSIRDIDSALTRPGRCFDVLEFRLLDRSEAILLSNKIGVQLPFDDRKEYSIAEIFGEQRHKDNSIRKQRPFGFV